MSETYVTVHVRRSLTVAQAEGGGYVVKASGEADATFGAAYDASHHVCDLLERWQEETRAIDESGGEGAS